MADTPPTPFVPVREEKLAANSLWRIRQVMPSFPDPMSQFEAEGEQLLQTQIAQKVENVAAATV